MPDKKEYEEKLNKLLGTNIKWSKLSAEEIEQIASLFSTPEKLMEKLGISKTPEQKIAEGLTEILMQRPLLTKLKQILEEK